MREEPFRPTPSLPVVRCASLRRLALLVLKEQVGREKDPSFRLSGDDNVVSGADIRISDLLHAGPEGYYSEHISKISAVRPFYWEAWNTQADARAGDSEVITYNFDVDLSGIEIGTIYGQGEDEDVQPLPVQFARIAHFVGTRFGPVSLWGVRFDHSVIFMDAQFDGTVAFNASVFDANAVFKRARFNSLASFTGTHFICDANFERATFAARAEFYQVLFEGGAWFGDASFHGETTFGYALFEYNATFAYTTWNGASNFEGATFKKTVHFTKAQFADDARFAAIVVGQDVLFNDSSFEASLFLDEVVLLPALPSHAINLSGVSVKAKLSFSMSAEEDYAKLQLGLYASTIAYFCCDDYEFHTITLMGQPVAWRDEPRASLDAYKTALEYYLHELRIKRKILQDMNWGDLADHCYADIMDQQLQFKRIEALRQYGLARWKKLTKWWVRRLVFKHIFGWGIRLGNIAWSAGLVLGAFWALYFVLGHSNMSPSWGIQSLQLSIQSFLGLDLPQNIPTAIVQAAIAEAALGYLLCTVFVVILARKFMRF